MTAFRCEPCAPSTYLVRNGTLQLGDARHSCAPCPFGGDCAAGGDGMQALAGYWGTGTDADSTVTFTECPVGMCCPSGGCAWDEACTPLHRDNAVPLCGECAPGYSATIGSSTCRNTDNCNDARWFVPVLLLLALAWTQFALVAGAPSKKGGVASQALTLLVYFYQMAQLLPVGATAVEGVLAMLAGLFNMQLHAIGGWVRVSHPWADDAARDRTALRAPCAGGHVVGGALRRGAAAAAAARRHCHGS